MPDEPTAASWHTPAVGANGNGSHPNGAAAGVEPADGTARFEGGAVVQVVRGAAHEADAIVERLHPATILLDGRGVVATDGEVEWSWLRADLHAVVHGADEPWSVFVVPGVADFGVVVDPADVDRFRRALERLPGVEIRYQTPPLFDQERRADDAPALTLAPPPAATAAVAAPLLPPPPPTGDVPQVVEAAPPSTLGALLDPPAAPPVAAAALDPALAPSPTAPQGHGRLRVRDRRAARDAALMSPPATLTGLEARRISAWFGSRQVLDRVSLDMRAGEVTALIGPSGCGKSTFLRILNRMHEMVPSASLDGEVLLDGHDVYDPTRKVTDARREIGMVFQKPNPFPAMSIYDNVVASLRLTGLKVSTQVKDELVESCLGKAGLWNEVKDRLRQPGGGLSGGQQQRLCIARALAIRPRVLLMDEPCSALDPTSTRRIEATIKELVAEVTIVIVTHNMQQAVRVSDQCAFFLAEHGTPGVIVEHGPTHAMFHSPQDPRTDDYVNGRFG